MLWKATIAISARLLTSLKHMMNGVIEEKKEQVHNAQPKEEEWMKKPRDEMKEEEIVAYDAFLEQQERAKEENEKLKKVLLQELKKLQTETKAICTDFDTQFDLLFMKRLEYLYRIHEQEFIGIRLKQVLLWRVDLIEKFDRMDQNNGLERIWNDRRAAELSLAKKPR